MVVPLAVDEDGLPGQLLLPHVALHVQGDLFRGGRRAFGRIDCGGSLVLAEQARSEACPLAEAARCAVWLLTLAA